MRYLQLLIVLIGIIETTFGQLGIQEVGEATLPNYFSALTPEMDVLDRPYLYVATNEDGLKIYDVSGSTPIEIDVFDSLELTMLPMSVTQEDSLLYVCIGSHFGTSNNPPGIAIIDVSDPTTAFITDIWVGTNPGHGTGIVKVQGNYAYVGAMYEGLIILDISDPYNIGFVSQLIPAIDFPHINNQQEKVNARGMAIDDTLVYLCYDAGGLRVINCADVMNPVEIEQFANMITVIPWNMPRAYNNVVLDDTLAYVAVDYCGIEVVDISDPFNLSLVTHYNPHDCPNGLWQQAPIHANELHLLEECELLFVSTGKSELLVIDIADPYAPVAVDSFGTTLDTMATWGLDMNDEFIYLTYLNVPTFFPSILVPFYALQGGVKKLSFTHCSAGILEENESLKIYPNPTHERVFVESGIGLMYVIRDMSGRIRQKGKYSLKGIDVSTLRKGVYLLELMDNNYFVRDRLVIN